MRIIAFALGISITSTVVNAGGPVSWARSKLEAYEAEVTALRSVPEAERDGKAVVQAEAYVITYRRLLAQMERSIAAYREEHGIESWKLGDKVRSPVITGEFLGAFGLDWVETNNSYGRPRYELGLWDFALERGVATVKITVHVSSADALEERLIGGALPAPPPLKGIGDVGFSRDPENKLEFIRDNCLVYVLVRSELGYRAEEMARRVDSMLLASPLALDPANPTATLEPGLESRLMPKVKGPIPGLPPNHPKAPKPAMATPAADGQ